MRTKFHKKVVDLETDKAGLEVKIVELEKAKKE